LSISPFLTKLSLFVARGKKRLTAERPKYVEKEDREEPKDWHRKAKIVAQLEKLPK